MPIILGMFPEFDFHHLFIIGNGFDKNHELKSGYGDFKNWLLSHHPEDVYLLSKFLPDDKKEMLWGSFEEALGNFDLDEVKNNDLQNFAVITLIDEDGKEHYIGPDIADPDIFGRLGRLFSEWAKDINKELGKVNPKYKFPDDSLFLTFNYTDTLELAYKITEDKVKHLNGRAATDDSVIIGHDRQVNPFEVYSSNSYNARKENNEFQQLSEYANLSKDGNKQVEQALSKRYKEYLSKVEEVTVMGHSYEKVDDSYFSTIIRHLPGGIIWRLGYHTEEDRNHLDTFIKKFEITDYNIFEF